MEYKVSKKSIKTREIYFYFRGVSGEVYRALNAIRAKLNAAETYRQGEITITTAEAKRLLRNLDRVQGAADLLESALGFETELTEAGLHTDVLRALDYDSVPLHEYKALAADYLRLRRAFDTAQKNLEAIVDAQTAAHKTDQELFQTLINWRKNGQGRK